MTENGLELIPELDKEVMAQATAPINQPAVMSARLSFGRQDIFSSVEEVTPGNVVEVLKAAIPLFKTNRAEIDYLYSVYKGEQDILYRVKTNRPEICNKVIVNRGNEVVSFKSSYLMGEPVQYVSAASAKADVTEKLVTLNEYMRMEGKAGKDMELANWFHICGLGYRLVLPDGETQDPQGSPFNIYILDPRDTFVIKYSGIGHRPLAGVHVVHRDSKPDQFCVYTKHWFIIVQQGEEENDPEYKISADRVNYPEVPIIEYVHNQAKMGAFEPVLSQLHEINVVESNRIDAIEQTVQSITVFENCDLDEAKFDEMRRKGAVKIKSSSALQAKVYAIKNELEQAGVQRAIDDLQASIYDICGMPATQNSGASTSDTGSAVMLRDGWQQAEARAKETEKYFELSENRFLRCVLAYCKGVDKLELDVADIKPQFTRRNYADLLTKSQVLQTLLAANISPKLAFECCTLFTDPDAAYQMSKPYLEKAQEQEKQAQQNPAAVSQGSRAMQPGKNGSALSDKRE